MATFGSIKNPLDTLNPNGYGGVQSGLPSFISNITTLIMIAGGLYAFFNMLVAGITYITASGDQKKIESAVFAINMSLLGLIVMVGAVVLTGIVSYILFGDATLILKPKIFGPGQFN